MNMTGKTGQTGRIVKTKQDRLNRTGIIGQAK
jgi:hypothetical protein